MAWLQQQPSQSLMGLSGFHIAEHLPFESLQALFQEAMRVLAPAGLLILETPNPENLLVGASYFHLDPSHVKPLPRQLLTFMAEHAGFARVKHLGLQEEAKLQAFDKSVIQEDAQLYLIDVLAGVSPDHAIVAQKASSQVMPEAFEAAWRRHHGVLLHDMAQRYEAQQKNKLSLEIQAQLAHQQEMLENLQAQIDSMMQSKIWRFLNALGRIYKSIVRW